MTMESTILLCAGLLAVSFLYSTVGHAGASGYIAVMSLVGLAPEAIKPMALSLNIVVASVGTWQFCRAGHFHWRTFWPYAVLAIPCAFAGGYLNLPGHVFRIVIGVVLLFSAVMLIVKMRVPDEATVPPVGVSLGVGAGLGFAAGLTGTGGGIFLTPTLLLFRWASTKTASATSAAFILVNSIAGLGGVVGRTLSLPPIETMMPLLAMVLVGGTIGSYFGSRKFSREVIKTVLACVLVLASVKLIVG